LNSPLRRAVPTEGVGKRPSSRRRSLSDKNVTGFLGLCPSASLPTPIRARICASATIPSASMKRTLRLWPEEGKKKLNTVEVRRATLLDIVCFTEDSRSSVDARVRWVIAFLMNNDLGDVDICKIAEAVNLSPSRLRHIFQEQVGLAFCPFVKVEITALDSCGSPNFEMRAAPEVGLESHCTSPWEWGASELPRTNGMEPRSSIQATNAETDIRPQLGVTSDRGHARPACE